MREQILEIKADVTLIRKGENIAPVSQKELEAEIKRGIQLDDVHIKQIKVFEVPEKTE